MNFDAKAPQRRRPKRVAKKLRQRGGYLHHDGAWFAQFDAVLAAIGTASHQVAENLPGAVSLAMEGLARCMQDLPRWAIWGTPEWFIAMADAQASVVDDNPRHLTCGGPVVDAAHWHPWRDLSADWYCPKCRKYFGDQDDALG